MQGGTPGAAAHPPTASGFKFTTRIMLNPYESPRGMEAGESPLRLAVQVVLFPFGALFVLSWFMAFGFLAIAVYPVVAGGVLAPGPFESRWGFTLFSASSVLWGAVLFFAVKFIVEVALNHA